MPHGVPQGSILGPLMFIMFINGLPLHMTSKDVVMDIYADDTTLTASADVNFISEMRQELTNSFKEVEDWAAANKLPLSEAKSKSALVTGKRLLDKIDQDDLQLEIPAKNGHVLEQVYCATQRPWIRHRCSAQFYMSC